MSVSKVIYNNNTLIDLTPSTAIADDVAEGKKFYLANGNSAIGTSQGGGGGEDYEIEVDNPSVDQISGEISTLPYEFISGCAVVYNNEIHILGGLGSSAYTKHYRWNGTEWVSVSTLPFNFYYGCAVVFNNEIHIMGGSGSSTSHYRWNGSSWTSVSTLPRNYIQGSAVVYNNEIHLIGNGANSYTMHYKWNGTSWSSVSTLPYDFYKGCAVVYNDEIYALGGGKSGTEYYYSKFNGSSWSTVRTLPLNFTEGSAVVYNDNIHLVGSSQDGYRNNHYKYNGNFSFVSYLPYGFFRGSGVTYNGTIHLLGGTNAATKHYALIPDELPTINITANGIYNLIGSKTEQNLNKLVTDLTGEVLCGVNVAIDTSGTATADKIASGYTAWVNGEKLTGTMAMGGTMYSASATPSSIISVTFSNLQIPYANISYYILYCSGATQTSTTVMGAVDGSAIATYYSSSTLHISWISGLSVSGSGNSITFTKNGGFGTSYTYYLYYC